MKPLSKAAQQRAARNVGADPVLGAAHLNGQRVPVRDPAPAKPIAALIGRFNLKEK